MRRALIADIHGNLVALEAVLHDCVSNNVDEIACLGDMAGFGPDVKECVDLVMQRCAWSLCGNHDVVLFGPTPAGFNQGARQAIDRDKVRLKPRWFSGMQTRKRWKWLLSLQPSKLADGVLYVHGSPRDPLFEWLFAREMDPAGATAKEIFARIDGLCFCAHSHRPGVVVEGNAWIEPAGLPQGLHLLASSAKTLVNVGSVGQPRDRNPASCYVIWDTAKQTILFRRIAYDLQAAKARFQRAPELDERLYLRLEQGM